MTHDASMAVGGCLEIGMLRQELRDLRLDGLDQQRARSVAQNLGELVIERPGLNQLDNAIVGQGISLLQWTVEASNTPTICRLHRQFTPSWAIALANDDNALALPFWFLIKLLALAWMGPHEQHPAMAEPHVRPLWLNSCSPNQETELLFKDIEVTVAVQQLKRIY